MAPKRLTRKERANIQHLSGRIQSTAAENKLAASMVHERPPRLYGDKNGNLISLQECFGSCTTRNKRILGSQYFKLVTIDFGFSFYSTSGI